MSVDKCHKKTKKQRIEELCSRLNAQGFKIRTKGVTTRVDRTLRAGNYGPWRKLCEAKRNEVFGFAEEKIKATAMSGRHHRKKWYVDGNQFNTRELHKHSRKLLADSGQERILPTEQNFGRFLNRLKESQSPIVSQDGTIKDVWSVLSALAYGRKNAPITAYRLRFVSGPARGGAYIGITQCTVEERVNWHMTNAKRNESGSNRLYAALAASLVYAPDRSKWLRVETLEHNIELENAAGREEYYCDTTASEVGVELLNVAKPGSVGGRQGTCEVSYKGQRYYLEEGIRAVAADLGVPSRSYKKFRDRFCYHRSSSFSSQSDLDPIAAHMQRTSEARKRGEKAYSKSAFQFLLDGIPMSLREAAHKCAIEPPALRSCLRRRGLLHTPGIELRPIIDGKIEPLLTKTPPLRKFLVATIEPKLRNRVNGIISELLGQRQSWAALARVTGNSPSTLRAWGREFERQPMRFWEKALS